MNNKFDTQKALKYREIYKGNKNTLKRELLDTLIAKQQSFGSKSIINKKIIISLDKYYRKKCVNDVLNDLGYEVNSFFYTSDISNRTLQTHFSIILKDN